jgi:undecaprenyl-diphosphatase
MSIIEAVILGLVQGLTEFIPVSSSGHLVLLHNLFGSSDNTLAFDVALHVGTLLALLLYFRKDLVVLLKNLFVKNEHGRLARLLIMATIPAVLAGLLLSDFIDENLRTPTVVAFALAGVAVIMLIVDKVAVNKKNTSEVSAKQGLFVGLAQVAALVPGVSRSGATMTAGILLGLSRVQAARFSFLLAIPIVAGSAAGIVLKDTDGLTDGNWQLGLGVVTAFLSGLLAIKFLLSIIAKVGLKPFAYYRIALAVIVLAVLV